MAKKYNSKRNDATLGSILKSDFDFHKKIVQRYANTQYDWKTTYSTKSIQEMNADLLRYAFEGNKKRVKVALLNGADINARDSFGNNALMLAVYAGKPEVVKFLLTWHLSNKGEILEDIEAINKNALNKDLLSCLHLGVHLNNEHVVQMLLDYGVNANIVGQYNETPIFTAVKANNFNMVELLCTYNLENKALVNFKNREGFTPLIVAAQNRARQESLLKLLECGAYIYAADNNGRTAFMHAANNNCSVMMDIFLKRAKDFNKLVNHQDNEGINALMVLAKRGNREAVRVLVARGANIFLKDNMGRDALDYAKLAAADGRKTKTCIEILEKAKRIYAEVDAQFAELDKTKSNQELKNKVLLNRLSEFATHNRVPNSCVK